MNKKFSKAAVVLGLSMTMVLTSVASAFACTGVYFGKDTTENGSTFIGRSEDSNWKTYKKFYTVHDAETHEEGDMYVSNSTNFKMPYPAKTLRYTLVKDFTGVGEEEMAEAGTNEKGVAVSGTVTISGSNAKVKAVDPTTGKSGGIYEEDIPSVVLMQANTSREGAQLLIDIYENYGAGGLESTYIVDGKEAWVVQALSGHAAVAVKCPADKVGTSPNITMNVDVTDDENTIATSGLKSIAEQAGTLVTDDKGNILVANSYINAATRLSDRLYNCYYYLKGKAFADSVTPGYYSYFQDPKEDKYSTYEALRFLAYRGENGGKYAGTSTGNGTGIGCDNNLEVHMFEARDNMPAELAVVQWESLGPAEFGCFIPGYNALVTSTIEENGNPENLKTMTYNNENPELNSFRTTYFELYFLCKGRDNHDGLTAGTAEARQKYGKHVQEFMEAYQKELIKQQKVIDVEMQKILASDKSLAEEKATALNQHLQKEYLGYIQKMVDELKAFEAEPQEGEYVPSCMGALPTYSFEALLEEKADKLEEEVINLQVQIKEQQDYIEQLKEDLAETQDDVTASQEKIEELEAALETANKELDELQDEMNQKLADLEKAFGGKLDENKHENDVLNAKLTLAVNNVKASAKATAYNKVTVSWKDIEDVDGFIVNGVDVKKDTFKKTYTVKTGVKKSVTVQAYVNVGDEQITLDAKKVTVSATAKPAKPSITSIKGGKGKVTVSYSKAGGATGYQIAHKKYGSSKSYKMNKTTKNTYTVSKLKHGIKEAVKVRAYTKTASGKIVYGSWSTVKTAKTK